MMKMQKAPHEYDGQLHVVLDGDPVQNVPDANVRYWDPVAKRMFEIGAGVLGVMKHDRTSDRQGRFSEAGLDHLMRTEVWMHTDDRYVGDRFAEQLTSGRLSTVLHIDSNGGDRDFSNGIIGHIERQKFRSASVVAFLQRNVKSAALRIAQSVPERHVSSRASLMWHYGRYVDRPSSGWSLELAKILASESHSGEEEAEEFARWLEANVTPSARTDAMRAFRRSKTPMDHEFRFSGSQAVEWGLAQSLNPTTMPSKRFESSTKIRLAKLEPDDKVRKFIESFDSYVDQESRITPLF